MPNELQNEINDVGRATDKPKGFVKWQLLAYWTMILGLASAFVVQIRINRSDAAQCALKQEQNLINMQKTIDDIRVEYQRKLEERMNRLENVEQRVDSLPKTK